MNVVLVITYIILPPVGSCTTVHNFRVLPALIDSYEQGHDFYPAGPVLQLRIASFSLSHKYSPLSEK